MDMILDADVILTLSITIMICIIILDGGKLHNNIVLEDNTEYGHHSKFGQVTENRT